MWKTWIICQHHSVARGAGQVKTNCSHMLLRSIVDAAVMFSSCLFALPETSTRSVISPVEVCAESGYARQTEANVTWRRISQIHFEVIFNSGLLLNTMEIERTNKAYIWSDIILWHFVPLTAAGLVLPQHFDGFKTSHWGIGSSPCSLLMWLGSLIMHCASSALCTYIYIYILYGELESIAHCYQDVCLSDSLADTAGSIWGQLHVIKPCKSINASTFQSITLRLEPEIWLYVCFDCFWTIEIWKLMVNGIFSEHYPTGLTHLLM